MVKRSSARPPRTISQIIEIAQHSRRWRSVLEIVQFLCILGLIGLIIGLVGFMQWLANSMPSKY